MALLIGMLTAMNAQEPVDSSSAEPTAVEAAASEAPAEVVSSEAEGQPVTEVQPAPEIQFPRVIKSLLLEALGVPFLAYVLAADESEIEAWLESAEDDFGTLPQKIALSQLHLVLHSTQDESNPIQRRWSLVNTFGIYQDSNGTTLVNVLRGIAVNEYPAPFFGSSLEDVLAKLVQDVHALYLLRRDPDDLDFGSPTSLYGHPLRKKFEELVMVDEVFANYFSNTSEHSGVHGDMLYRSSGHGSGMQLVMFDGILLSSGWRAAEITSQRSPTLEEHVRATLGQLSIIRNVLSGKTVRVPVRVAFTGVRLASNEPLELGWGTLRPADGRETSLVPRGIEGQLSGTGADGVEVLIDYSGDVILDSTIEYRAIRRKQSVDGIPQPWPKELIADDPLTRMAESVQLGALLSQEYSVSEPIAVIPTWRYIHDPLGHGYSQRWADPQRGRGFMPKKFSKGDGEKWRESACAVERHRTRHVGVAIRRTLRASVERRDYVDTLVDSVIAWENLFGSSQGESTLRVSSSMALLLEIDVEKRTTLRAEIGKLYGDRSKVVHGVDVSAQDLVTKAQRALELAIAVLRVMFTDRLDLLSECKDGGQRSIRLMMGG